MAKAEHVHSGSQAVLLREYAHSAQRRTLLGALAVVPVAAIAPASAGEAQDPHLGWLAEYYADRARADQIEADDEANAAYSATLDITNRILDREPATVAGVAAQLMMIVEIVHMGFEFDRNVTGEVLERAAELLPVPTWYDCTPEEA